MTEKEAKKQRYAKPLSLLCHIENFKVRHANQWHLFVEVQVAVRVLCGAIAVFKFVTLCPFNMYFLLYRTLKAVFVDKFGCS